MATVERAKQVRETRELMLAAAERLFAERGVAVVSGRQIGEAARQGNNTAVSYHFGSKDNLVRAIVRKHGSHIETLREQMLADLGDGPELRDWVGCLVRPFTDHLAALDGPTWYAQFAAQVMTDPGLRDIVIQDTLAEAPLRRVIEGINRWLPTLPAPVRADRNEMARQLIIHMCAARERSLNDGAGTSKAAWQATAASLVDAIVGLLSAPVVADQGPSLG
ncbi:TetR/AcrR family transcriptional regulator [Micromonospora sp. NPDC003197]